MHVRRENKIFSISITLHCDQYKCMGIAKNTLSKNNLLSLKIKCHDWIKYQVLELAHSVNNPFLVVWIKDTFITLNIVKKIRERG